LDRHSFVARTSPFDAPNMPPGTRVRYLAPDPTIADAITGYNCYGTADDVERVDPFMPAMAMVTVLVDAAEVSVRVGSSVISPLSQVALYGAMSRPFYGTTRGGVMIGIGISPIGWARLSKRPLSDLKNRIVPLGQAFGRDWGERLARDLAATDSDEAIKQVLDAALLPLLSRRHAAEPMIAAFGAMVAADGDIDIRSAAARLGIDTALLRRLAQRYFGLPPKLLLRRARFVRSFIRNSGLLGGTVGAIDASYFDQSHYLRDALDFIGTTPRRFLAQPAVFMRGSLLARAKTLGAAHQSLHYVPPVASELAAT
jgi:hypothetical protein